MLRTSALDEFTPEQFRIFCGEYTDEQLVQFAQTVIWHASLYEAGEDDATAAMQRVMQAGSTILGWGR